MACLKFSKNCLNVSMEQQCQHFFRLCIILLSVFTIFLICIWCFPCNTTFVFKRLIISYRIFIIINSKRVIIIKRRTIRLIPVVIPQTSCCFSVILLYSSKLYIGITTSRSSAFSINTLLIFDMQLVNGAFFLNVKNLFHMSIFLLRLFL